MATVQFNCPHCQGVFQVDDSLGGMQVSCPHCQQVATLPASMSVSSSPGPASATNTPIAPVPSMPAPSSAPISGSSAAPSSQPSPGGVTQFNCPRCQGEFRIGTSMAGQRVTCPHCTSVVVVPVDIADRAPVQTPRPVPAPTPQPSLGKEGTPAAGPNLSDALYPPGFGPQAASSQPVPSTPTAPTTPVPSQPAPSMPSAENTASNMYPPGFTPPGGDATPDVAKQNPQPVDLPSSSLGAPITQPSAPVEKTPTYPPDPVATGPQIPVQPSSAPIDNLLPPGATASESPANLLQPGAGTSAATNPEWQSPASTSQSPVSKSSRIEEMLPPGVSPSTPSTTLQPQDDPFVSSTPQPVTPKTADDTVAIPTDDGGFVTVKEKVKTVEFHGEEVEVRRLTPEEKQRKRFIKNIIMAILGVLFLTVVTVILMALT